MTDLIINGTAITRSSRGARRYYDAVMSGLEWPGKVSISPPSRWGKLARLTELAERGHPDAIYWSPAHRGPLFAYNHVVTVLDCINIEYTYRHDRRLPVLRAMFGALLTNAHSIVSISSATKAAILRNFPISSEKIEVIAGPIDLSAMSRPQLEGLERSTDDFVLMITNSLPHKNTELAGAAFAASRAARNGITLRVVGSLAPAGLAACDAAGVRVERYSGISDSLLFEWVRRARFLFSPSLDEGLNLPIGEAIMAGTNVLCSDIAVHREFYEGSVAFFDPFDLGAAIDALDAAFGRTDRWYKTTSQQKFSSAAVGDKYNKLFQTIV